MFKVVLELRVHKVPKDPRVTRGHKAIRALREIPERKEVRAHKVPKEYKGRLVHKAIRELRVA